MIEIWLESLLWISMSMVLFVTAGYPLLLAISKPLARRSRRIEDAEPSVSLIIAAHNEEKCIAAKLENSLNLDYPSGLLEIIVASDGSTDRTDEVVQSFADRGVILYCFPRTGKTGVQNEVVRKAKGEILVFSDANAFYHPDAIRKLVRNFADPEVACVSGQLVYRVTCACEGAGRCERSYWDYEKFMKLRESEISSLVGVNGSIYALRSTDYVEIENDLISDLVEPLALVLKGRRVVYEPEAVSVEDAYTTYNGEFRRKVRILTRSIQGVLHMRALLNPLRYGVFSFQLLFHKFLRYLIPFFLSIGAASLMALAALGQYRMLLLFAGITVLISIAVGLDKGKRQSNPVMRVFHIVYYYLVVNSALVLAWCNIFRGTRLVLWAPERDKTG